MKMKFTIILITSIISILHAKGYPIAWGYIYRYIDGQLVPVSGAKPLILEGNPPYFPPPSTNQPFDFESDVSLFTADSNSNASKNCAINFYPLCNWSDSGFSVFDVKFFSINNRNFIALTGQYTTPLQFRFRIIEYFPESQNL